MTDRPIAAEHAELASATILASPGNNSKCDQANSAIWLQGTHVAGILGGNCFYGAGAFFGIHMPTGGHGSHGKMDFLVNVTETLQNLKRRDQLQAGEPLSVQLVAVPATKQFTRPETELALEEVEFIVSPVLVFPK